LFVARLSKRYFNEGVKCLDSPHIGYVVRETSDKLVDDLFRKDACSEENIGDLQDFVKLVANASITLAGIALATVALQ
jgi:hypothetical protein